MIDARHLTKRFGDFTAVRDVSLTVEGGEVVGLLGANGAGKTTLIRMILGLLQPTEGSVRLFGLPPSRATRARIGYVPQGLGLYADLTVAENLAFGAAAFGVDRPPLDPTLARDADRLVGAIPLGARRRASFAMALQHTPELLMLDEPTSGVDPLARARLWDQIRRVAEAGAAVLVSTHYMDEARQADRLVLMASGVVVATGSADDLVGDATTVQVEAGDWQGAFTALDGAGLPVMLDGRRTRVPGADRAEIETVLRDAGVAAVTSVVPATLEEVMVVAES